ncbi:hypothetical protein DEO72_LG5g1313 [Vigna unguiculata]|uniref:Uncharacterized protein n=1 Tax=Vigna unguiculata TaxID=3917 RepID=A0A4D6LY07_VIGUN|nr:hypothetical protein DEO72_LG5g1313 [Vigna unguiculata]
MFGSATRFLYRNVKEYGFVQTCRECGATLRVLGSVWKGLKDLKATRCLEFKGYCARITSLLSFLLLPSTQHSTREFLSPTPSGREIIFYSE